MGNIDTVSEPQLDFDDSKNLYRDEEAKLEDDIAVAELRSEHGDRPRLPMWKRVLAGNADGAQETKRAMSSRHLMMIGTSPSTE